MARKPRKPVQPSRRLHRIQTPEGRMFREAMEEPQETTLKSSTWDELISQLRASVEQQKCLFCECAAAPRNEVGAIEVLPELWVIVPLCSDCKMRGDANDRVIRNALSAAVSLWVADPKQFPRHVGIAMRRGKCWVAALPEKS